MSSRDLFPGYLNGTRCVTMKEFAERTETDYQRVKYLASQGTIHSLDEMNDYIKFHKAGCNPDSKQLPQYLFDTLCYFWEDVRRASNLNSKGLEAFRKIYPNDARNTLNIIEQYILDKENKGFPIVYEGTTFNSWRELYRRTGYSANSIRKIRNDFNLQTPLELLHYLSKSSDNSVVDRDSNLCVVASHKLASEYYVPKKISDTAFWLCKRVFFHSVTDACSYFSIPVRTYSSYSKLYGESVGFRVSLVYSLYMGIELLWYDSDCYFRLDNKGTSEYLSSFEIIDRYLDSYTASSLEDLCTFYSLNPTLLDYLQSKGISRVTELQQLIRKTGALIMPKNLNKKSNYNLKNGVKTYKEAINNSNKKYGISVYEPIFDNYDIVGRKKNVFSSIKELKVYYGLSAINKSCKDKDFNKYIRDMIWNKYIERQEHKVFLLGVEFDSRKSCSQMLGFGGSYLYQRGINAKDVEHFFITGFFSKDTKISVLNNILKRCNVEVLRFSFESSDSDDSYFLCKFLDAGRIKNTSSTELLQILVDNRREL